MRLRHCVEAFTYDMYAYTCLGLFEKHKLSLSFQMCLKIAETEGHMDSALLDFFLKGNLSLERTTREKPGEWWPDQGWHDFQRLITLGADDSPLRGLLDLAYGHPEEFRAWFESERPETAPLPANLGEVLGTFEMLCLLRTLRTDRVTVGITRYVMAALGEKYVQPPVLDYKAIYTSSGPSTPVVFVLSPGADPAFDVFRLGEDMVRTEEPLRECGCCVVWFRTCCRLGDGVKWTSLGCSPPAYLLSAAQPALFAGFQARWEAQVPLPGAGHGPQGG